jgi:hypothetical protein
MPNDDFQIILFNFLIVNNQTCNSIATIDIVLVHIGGGLLTVATIRRSLFSIHPGMPAVQPHGQAQTKSGNGCGAGKKGQLP